MTDSRAGLLMGAGAFALWGLYPFNFKSNQLECGKLWTVSTTSRVRVTRLPHASSNFAMRA